MPSAERPPRYIAQTYDGPRSYWWAARPNARAIGEPWLHRLTAGTPVRGADPTGFGAGTGLRLPGLVATTSISSGGICSASGETSQ